MKYLWESPWYKVVVEEKGGKVSGAAAWDKNGYLQEYQFPWEKIRTTGKVYEQMTARNVYSKIFLKIMKSGADVGREFGPLGGFMRARIIEDNGQGLLL